MQPANDPLSKLGDFHYTGTKGSYDYSYDGNGNLILDNNKAISSIAYNYLNLPNTVTVTNKGTITYTYDAAGNKLLKATVDNTITPSKTTTTTYIGGIVYQNDTLQFVPHEEGRARWALHKYTNGTSAYGFEYDFFLKDHLGNTRMVLTQEKDTAKYMATMEAAYRTTENALFYNIPQSSYPRSSVAGYPTDNTTVPNDSLARVNGSGQKVGPSIVLKVMSGDVVDIAAKSYWTTNSSTTNSPSITDALNSLANGIFTLTGGSKGTLSQLNTTTSPLYTALNSFINANDPAITGKPKAYLNWILLDEQFNYVNSYPQSGAIPVSNFAAGTLGTPGYTGIPITKSGYLYIYVSNETQNWDVFFDNLTIQHRSGPVTEETHYYPFGLTMAGISSKALNGAPENKYKFNKGSELQHNEFSDGSGLELYDTHFRQLDPQLGRWWQIDPKPDYGQSMYSAMNNNPISFNDPLGDTIRTSFRTGFLGIFGKKANLTYDEKNQRWNNKDGSAYTGKTNKFSKMVLGDLKTNQKNGLGNAIVTNLATDKLDHNIKRGDPNSNRTDDPNIYYSGSHSDNQKIVEGGAANSSPSYVVLGHEMAHKFDINLGIKNYPWFGDPPEQRGVDEYNAMYYENILRQTNGLPRRSAYVETNGVTRGNILDAKGNLEPLPANLASQGISLPLFNALQTFLRF